LHCQGVSGAAPEEVKSVGRQKFHVVGSSGGNLECTGSFAEQKRENHCLLWNGEIHLRTFKKFCLRLWRISFTDKKETIFQLRLSIGHLRMVDFPPTIGRHKVVVIKRHAPYESCHSHNRQGSHVQRPPSRRKSPCTRYSRTVLRHAIPVYPQALPLWGRRP